MFYSEYCRLAKFRSRVMLKEIYQGHNHFGILQQSAALVMVQQSVASSVFSHLRRQADPLFEILCYVHNFERMVIQEIELYIYILYCSAYQVLVP